MGHTLVIDDEMQVRSSIRLILEQVGYEVVEASDGKEGMRLQREKPAELVITDLIMPEQEGMETIMELRRDYPEIKIIAISGGGCVRPESYLEVAGTLGADRTLQKTLLV